MPRPQKPVGSHARSLTITLAPPVVEKLDEIAADEADGNRSAVVARLIQDEAARRRRRKSK